MTSSSPRAPWDGGYHTWLEHKALLRDLLTRYSPPELLAEIDLDGLEFYKTDFYLLPDFEKRDGDMVIRLPRPHREQEAWLWLLVEVQGSQAGDMALRALGYVYGLYLHLLRQQPQLRAVRGGALRMPPVFVLVLYHGQEAWREPEDLWGLIDLPEDSPLWRFQPQIHFWLLREQQPFPLDLPLAQESNLAALLLRLNRCHTLGQIMPVLQRLFVVLEEPQHHDLRPVLAAWVLQVLNKKHKLEVTKDDLAPLWQEDHMTSEPFYSTVREELILMVTGKTVEQLKEEWLLEFEQTLTQRDEERRIEFEKNLTQRLEPEIARRLEPEIAQRLEPEIAQRLEPEIAQRLEPQIAQRLEPQIAQRLKPEIAQNLEPEIERKTRRQILLEILVERFGDDPRWSALVTHELTVPQLRRLSREAITASDKEAFCALASASDL